MKAGGWIWIYDCGITNYGSGGCVETRGVSWVYEAGGL